MKRSKNKKKSKDIRKKKKGVLLFIPGEADLISTGTSLMHAPIRLLGEGNTLTITR